MKQMQMQFIQKENASQNNFIVTYMSLVFVFFAPQFKILINELMYLLYF